MIKIEKLDFYYKKKHPILQDFTTKLSPGKIYGLLGLNGEGKTTLLKLIAGLAFPKMGTITFNNNYLSSERTKAQLEQLYMIPDQPISTSLRIQEFINIYSVFYKDFSKEYFVETLTAFQLELNNKINSLSFGQQKKFHLAFALATNTKFLLLDEPTNGLDIPSKTIFRRLLAKAIDKEKTIIISTHLVHDIANLIDHLLIIKDAKLVLDSDINRLQETYAFGLSNQLTDDVLYAEKSIANYKTIRRKEKQTEESPIDIELLFNAIQNNKI